VRAVLDVNVLIASLLAPSGASAQLMLRWLGGAFELIISDRVVAELRRALSYPKVLKRVPVADALAFVDLLEAAATRMPDPRESPSRTRDADDDHLLALASSSPAVVVTGDQDLLELSDAFPIYSPAAFLGLLEQ
jgi:putative PIN family toxin of toxin-antitoxin system